MVLDTVGGGFDMYKHEGRVSNGLCRSPSRSVPKRRSTGPPGSTPTASCEPCPDTAPPAHCPRTRPVPLPPPLRSTPPGRSASVPPLVPPVPYRMRSTTNAAADGRCTSEPSPPETRRLQGLRKALQAVYHRDQNVLNPQAFNSFSTVSQYRAPSLLSQPQGQDFLATVLGHPDPQMNRPVSHRTGVPNLHLNRIQIHDRIPLL